MIEAFDLSHSLTSCFQGCRRQLRFNTMRASSVSLFVKLLFVTTSLAAPRWNDPEQLTTSNFSMGPDGRSKYYNSKTKDFWVNGTAGAIPDVKFNIPESYAGLLPIGNDDSRQLYFWYFPTTGDSKAEDDLVIWLNGGPGCSSLQGLLQENGPFTWKAGTYLPTPNKYTWVNLTNIVYIDQPVGTGFSQGEPNIHDEAELADQFLGFLKNFIDKFDLHKKRLWITGESYAGMYVPYIANAIYTRYTESFNLKGIMIYDPFIASDLILDEIPVVPFVERNQAIFNLADSTLAELKVQADKCGYTDIYKQGLTFPPMGKLNITGAKSGRDCSLWSKTASAAVRLNPCFNVYRITDTCPSPWDVIKLSGDDFDQQPDRPKKYFNRPEVQKAINAPIMTDWVLCGRKDVFPFDDKSEGSAPSGVLSNVIERSERTIVAHGLHDYVLIADGTLIALNNMTWHGAQGFTERPSNKFIVPNQGEMGVWREERGLTYIEVKMSGHMVPENQPQAAYRHLEYLLGRVANLSSMN
ncbi:hypothetical protein TWF694_006428 [Orbilia ellipsospora]|uniref:Carboxypeptidase n=1 Tax=Orbilia ellipsospora TaxID=2528407 RepID=A0AAV9XL14_9PEZI